MNSFGNLFKITIYGTSHEEEIGVLIEGVPAGIKLVPEDFSYDLSRRLPKCFFETKRQEEEKVIIKSGVYNNYTTGNVLAIALKNKNTDSSKYLEFYHHPRPGHADFSQLAKSKYVNLNGGGICSGRLTALIVIAGVVAKKIYDFNVTACVLSVKGEINQDKIDEILLKAKQHGDSVGGIVNVSCNLIAGLGDPFFSSLESNISHMMFSIPGVKGIEFGSGFSGTNFYGSEFNDLIIDNYGKTLTNHSGGINGGISNGNTLTFNLAIRPPASIYLPQVSFNFKTNQTETLLVEGRHDTTFIYRSLVVFEAALNIVLINYYLKNKLYNS